jgi:predicted transposase YbfD/YdcC
VKKIEEDWRRGNYLFTGDLDLKYEWDKLKYVIKIIRNVKHKNGKISEEIAYFITNLREIAKFFNKGIRNHWKIENSLHYIKDVVFKEDSLKIRSGMAPQNFSLLRSFVMNVLRKNGYASIMQATRLLALNIGAMMALLC